MTMTPDELRHHRLVRLKRRTFELYDMCFRVLGAEHPSTLHYAGQYDDVCERLHLAEMGADL